MMTEHLLQTLDDRALFVEEADGPRGAPVLIWHNGSPHTGRLLAPVVAHASAVGFRVVTYARPSYGASTPRPGRSVASAADDVAVIADVLGLERFAVAGASGGGPHALACAALLPELVTVAATFASPAPITTTFDWFDGMAAPGAFRSALEGRGARARYAETDTFDPSQFVAADWAALEGEWGPLGQDAGTADAAGPDGLIDDDVAFVNDWGFDPATITVPVVIAQGTEDRVIPATHGQSLGGSVPGATLWLREGAGHVSILESLPEAFRRLRSLVG